MTRPFQTGTLTLLGRLRSKRSLALALAITLLAPSAATLLLPAAASAQAATTASDLSAIKIPTVPVAEGPIRTILMFPFTNKIASGDAAGGFDADIVGARVENAVKLRLNTIGRYKANSFTPTLPQIQRAITESGFDGLTETDVSPPYDTALKGRKISDAVATDGYMLGTIEAIQTNTQTRTVSLTVTATLYSTQTGRAVKALAYTGRGISYNNTDNPEALLQSAINDASGHIVSALNADRVPQVVRRDTRKRQGGPGPVVLGLLLAAAVAIGITASHHGHHSSGTTTTTPVTPVTPVSPGGPPGVPGI